MIDEMPLLQDLPTDVRETLLRVLVLFVALAVIWVTRNLLSMLVIAPLRRLTRRTASNLDDQMLDALIAPIRLIVIALGAQLSAQLVLPNDSFFRGLIDGFARTLIVIAVLMGIYRMVDILLQSSRQLLAVTGFHIEDSLMPFVRVAIKLFVMAVGLVIVLQVWGFDITGLVAGIGIGGLGLTLAAQDTVANLFGFISIVGDRPFDVGDFIKTPDVEGIVEHVGLRSTRVRQLNQALVTVPNAKLANSAILNWSRLYKRQVDFILGVTYSTDINEMSGLLERLRAALLARESVQKDSVVVYFINFGPSALEILIRCYVLIAGWADFTAERESINLEIIGIVREMGLEVAFPTQTIHVQQVMARDPRFSAPPLVSTEPETRADVSEGSDTGFSTSSAREH